MKCCFSLINVITMGRITFSLFAALFCALSSPLASAQSFETLVMPGKLTEAHAKIEKECTKCHAPFKKAEQSKLCLDCHKPVAEDVAAKRGFHGLAPAVQGKECKSCHADHKGRETKIAAFDTTKFNHAHTDANLVIVPRINIAMPLQRASPAIAKTISTKAVWARNVKAVIATRLGKTPNSIMRKRAFR
jgi:predicted CXXCH cytochrome family protein